MTNIDFLYDGTRSEDDDVWGWDLYGHGGQAMEAYL